MTSKEQHWFNVPMTAVISVRVRECNADFAVSQAEGELGSLFDLLDDLRRVGNPKSKVKKTQEELVAEIIQTWDKMDLVYGTIEEMRDAS